MQAFAKDVVIDTRVRGLCTRPYPNHPKGCPNFGKRATCPPKCPLLSDVYNLNAGFWIVWVEFDFAAYCKKMRDKHPNWSQRQVECCLYWQGGVNKRLREAVNKVWADQVLRTGIGFHETYCPEAMGVNVTETMRKLGVELEWPPQGVVRKVALIGRLKEDG